MAKLTKKLTIGVITCFILGLFFISCNKETTTPQNNEGEKLNYDCDTVNASFANDIQPILNTSCAKSGCHVGDAPAGGLDLSDLNQVTSNAQNIKNRTSNGSMPKGGSLTEEQIVMIACWADSGGSIDN